MTGQLVLKPMPDRNIYTHTYKLDNNPNDKAGDKKKSKGIKQCIIKNKITFEDFVKCLRR